MAISWVVNEDCVAKQKLGVDQIHEALRADSRAANLIRLHRRDDPDMPVEEMTAEVGILTPQGMETRQMTVPQLQAQAASLRPYAPACQDCPANVGRQAFGCLGWISYPISARGERWLMMQLPESLLTPLGLRIWMVWARDKDWHGRAFADLRRRQGRYFELARAPARVWDVPTGTFTLTADQLYHGLLCIGRVSPVHAAIMCFFLGAVEAAELDRFAEARDPTTIPPFRWRPNPRGEATQTQFELLFMALHRAAALDRTVDTSY